MKAFANLFRELDQSNRTTDKVDALVRYFETAQPADAAWAIYFLIGRKPRQAVSAGKLRGWAAERAGLPIWLVDESVDVVGDTAESIALLLTNNSGTSGEPLHVWVEQRLLPLIEMEEADRRAAVERAWDQLGEVERFIWNKLILGGFRVGVSQLLVVRALAQVSGLPNEVIAHRLMGDWSPTPKFYQQLTIADQATAEASRPYPFFLAQPLDGGVEQLGSESDWQAEWKWDGIRAQLIRRQGQTFLWSRGEDLVTDRYPEIAGLASKLPEGTVLDGELLPWKDGRVMPFAQLQKRIGRKVVSKKLLGEIPVALVAYDVMEVDGVDRRAQPLRWRREQLENLVVPVDDARLIVSPRLLYHSWADLAAQRAESRGRSVEGIMLKRLDSPYRSGRVRGDWWKWKIDPFTIDAVLIYAQKGNGKRANLFTDYTFGVWDDGALVPIAKAYSGLTDDEIRKVDAFVRAHTLERMGPVRTVKPELVFELGFEGIQTSARHKSGIAVRFPRMLRWRIDKPASEADTLANVRRLLSSSAP